MAALIIALMLASCIAVAAMAINFPFALAKTARQRGRLIQACSTLEELDAMHWAFDEHAWRLVTFRDPWVIYPAVLNAAVAKARTK